MALSTHQQKHVETWRASGLMQVAYCRQCELNSKTFSNWLRFYRSGRVAIATPTLIPVEIKSIACASGSLRLRCPQEACTGTANRCTTAMVRRITEMSGLIANTGKIWLAVESVDMRRGY